MHRNNYHQLAFLGTLILYFSCTNVQVLGQDESGEFGTTEEPPRTIGIVIEAGDLGKIQGYKMWTPKTTRPYHVFSCVPYAKPVVKEKRFQPSELVQGPLSNDDKPFPALNILNICAQDGLLSARKNPLAAGPFLPLMEQALAKYDEQLPNSSYPKASTMAVLGGENCLTLSVHTPVDLTSPPPDDKLVPVNVYIHGGSFTSVWGSLFNGGRLMEKDVVHISMNYRLGILGFFNLGIKEAPGNAAMYDMLTALEWIQKYVRHFGGDPNRVTINGESAGAVAVTHLLMSPMGEGLFHAAIASSGTALLEWAAAEDPIPPSLRVAELAECYHPVEGVDPNLLGITVCMQDKETSVLLTALNAYTREERATKPSHGFWANSPSVQNPIEGMDQSQIFLPESPLKIMMEGKQKKIPLMIGANRHDGSYPLRIAYDEFLIPSGNINDPVYIKNDMLGDVLRVTGVEDKTNAVIDALGETYMGSEANESDDLETKFPGLIDLFSVFFFKAMALRTAELHSEHVKETYLYSFDYQGMWTLIGLLNFNGAFPMGVGHADDLLYTFQFFPLIRRDDMAVSDRFVEYWTNFIQFHNPNGETGDAPWPAYNTETSHFLRINKEDSVGNNYKSEWKNVAMELYPPDQEVPSTTEGPVEITTLQGGATDDSDITTPQGGATEDSNITTPQGSVTDDPVITTPQEGATNPDSGTDATTNAASLSTPILCSIISLFAVMSVLRNAQ